MRIAPASFISAILDIVPIYIVNIRQANKNDAKALLNFLKELSAENCNTITAFETLPSLEQEINWLNSKDGENGIVFIAHSENEIIGMLDASIPSKKEFNHTCEFGMSVHVNHRRKGIGRQLIEKLIIWAKKVELEIIELNVFSNNKAGIKLYEKLGFKIDGKKRNYIKRNGNYLDLLHMAKELGLINKIRRTVT